MGLKFIAIYRLGHARCNMKMTRRKAYVRHASVNTDDLSIAIAGYPSDFTFLDLKGTKFVQLIR